MFERRNQGDTYKGTWWMLTFLLFVIIAAEYGGLFNGLNIRIASLIPKINFFWMELITDSASFAAFLLYILLLVALDVKRLRALERSTLHFAASLAVSMLAVGILKAVLQTPRPGEAAISLPFLQALLNADYFAFPSGHAARASVLAVFLSRRFPRYRAIWWAYAVLIALSRLFLHVHWFSDVLFSLLLGPWAYLLAELTERKWLPIYRTIITALKLEVFDVERIR